ncbi:DUF481 domain-containing protein [Kaarinaea lacus]
MRTLKIITAMLTASWIVTIPQQAHATEEYPDKFKITLGGYTLARNESELSLTDRTLGAGVSISPEDTLGLETEQTVIRLGGHYRFNQEHAVTFSWYSISSDGTKRLEEEIDWVDENGNPITIPVGARVDTRLEYDIYKLGYLWSFYNSEKVELAAGAGLHVTRVALGLEAETTSSDVGARDVAVTFPLPVLSFELTYHVTPKFNWFLQSEVFSIEFEDWAGTYSDNSLGMEYRVMKNLGLGIALANNTFKVNQETDEYKFVFANRVAGIALYATGHF